MSIHPSISHISPETFDRTTASSQWIHTFSEDKTFPLPQDTYVSSSTWGGLVATPETGVEEAGTTVPRHVCHQPPGRPKSSMHDIKTPPGTIVRHWPYRIPEDRHQAIEEEVAPMHRDSIIKPSNSPYANPIVIVPKSDRSLRLSNAISEFNSYPLSRVDNLIEVLGGA